MVPSVTAAAMERYSADSQGRIETRSQPPVVIDLCAALSANRLHLEAALRVLSDAGVESAIYSALPAWNTRAALRSAGMLEWFDHIWHVDAIARMDRSALWEMSRVRILGTPDALRVRALMRAGGIPASRIPLWLRGVR